MKWLFLYRCMLFINLLINQLRRIINHKLMIVLKGHYSHLLFYLQRSNQWLISQSSPHITDISESGQKAVLSTAIIREVVYSLPPQSFSDLSLRDKILQLNPKINNAQISPKSKNEVFELLTTGIRLNDRFFNQNRLIQGKQLLPSNQHYKKFIFCPNYLATRQIFNLLLLKQNDSSDVIVTGSSGIAKNISYIFYIHVSNYIHKFYQQAQEDYNKKIEFDNLVKLNLIQIVPKCFYLSFDEYHDDFFMQQLIYEQSTQLSEQKRKILHSKKNNFDQFSRHFAQAHKGQIHIKLIVDQLNQMVSLVKQWRKICLKLETIRFQGSSQYAEYSIYQDKKHKVIESFQKMEKDLKRFRKFGDCFVFNSLRKIQSDLFKSQGQCRGIGLINHCPPKFFQIEFSNLLKNQKWSKIDFWQYFWFQIQRNLLGKITSINLDELKKMFLQTLAKQQIDTKSYFRFIYVRMFLKTNGSKLDSINKTSTIEQIKQILSQMGEKFYKYCLGKILQTFKDFLLKDIKIYEDKKKFISKIYLLAVWQCAKKQYHLQVPKEQFLDMALWSNYYIFDNQIQYTQFFDKQILNFQIIQDKSIKFTMSSFQMLQILAHTLYPKIAHYLPFDCKIIQNLQQNPSLRGYHLKSSLIDCLKEGTTVQFPVFINKKKQQTSAKLPQYTISDICQFQSLSHTYEDNQIEKQFKNVLQVCEKFQNQYFVGIPHKNGEHDFECPSIDFIIVKYSSQLKTYDFNTFEVTVQNTPTFLKQKINKAVQLFENLLQKTQNFAIKLKHTVLCSTLKNQGKRHNKSIKIYDSQRFSVHYGDWSQIKFLRWKKKQLNNINEFGEIIYIIKKVDSVINKVNQRQKKWANSLQDEEQQHQIKEK